MSLKTYNRLDQPIPRLPLMHLFQPDESQRLRKDLERLTHENAELIDQNCKLFNFAIGGMVLLFVCGFMLGALSGFRP